ncbi:MAG: hypothetical protein NC247_04070 [Ruminococcus flavefaciens]|nr:hypothetical protein [Ruminococcus flavefaciens]MCM1363051.1 hypothetical protein [Clostridiales bacterium]
MTQGIKNGESDAKIVYADIIQLPHWQSPKRKHMSTYDRAAQFSPFAALTDYEDMIDEEAREVGAEIQLSEIEMDVLNAKINLLSDMIENGEKPEVTITYFVPDALKHGGAYVQITDRVRKIDLTARKIQLYKKVGVSDSYMMIDMDKVVDISGDMLDRMIE